MRTTRGRSLQTGPWNETAGGAPADLKIKKDSNRPPRNVAATNTRRQARGYDTSSSSEAPGCRPGRYFVKDSECSVCRIWGDVQVRAAPWSSAGLHLNNAKHFITRVNELQGQATTLEVSTVVVLHSGIDEARQTAWPGRRGCTPRPSQPSQLRRRLTARLVGSRIALRKTEIPPGILNPVTDKTRTGQAGRGQDEAGFLDGAPHLGTRKSWTRTGQAGRGQVFVGFLGQGTH
jgi:hypothetical protein